MHDNIELLKALSLFLSAIVWPAFFGVLTFSYRREVRSLLVQLPNILERVRKVKGFGFETEIDVIALNAPSTGEITPEQQRLASRLASLAGDIGAGEFSSQLDNLCLQYDTLRRRTKSGSTRTREMTQILVKMRAIGPSVIDEVETYKVSGSAGSRLAAVAIMQMRPQTADIQWLAARFAEEAPFVFYHAALALTNAAHLFPERRGEIEAAARNALDQVGAFAGEPDRETLRVLRALLDG